MTIKDPGGSGMLEATITINGVPLSFAESMTMRVAIGSFLMHVTDPENAKALGPIAKGYAVHLNTVSRILHDPLHVARENQRREHDPPNTRILSCNREYVTHSGYGRGYKLTCVLPSGHDGPCDGEKR